MTGRRGKEKSVLMTPDPYHVPGYGGFCPQFKYHIGETFGRTTCRLLDDKGVASSGQLVLANINPKDDPETVRRAKRVELIQTRTHSWGDQKLMEKMVPGYTGFIPKSQHHFGARYAENCVSAVSDFEADQLRHNDQLWQMGAIDALQRGKPFDVKGRDVGPVQTKYKTPLEPIADKAKPYITKNPPQHTMSPYYMNNENKDKRFMSGYTGFVPRSRGMLGAGYPLITHTALNDFTDNTKMLKDVASKPIEVKKKDKRPSVTKNIYPTDTGLVPHYTGHIPGEKFRYGDTFGHSTQDALQGIS